MLGISNNLLRPTEPDKSDIALGSGDVLIRTPRTIVRPSKIYVIPIPYSGVKVIAGKILPVSSGGRAISRICVIKIRWIDRIIGPNYLIRACKSRQKLGGADQEVCSEAVGIGDRQIRECAAHLDQRTIRRIISSIVPPDEELAPIGFYSECRLPLIGRRTVGRFRVHLDWLRPVRTRIRGLDEIDTRTVGVGVRFVVINVIEVTVDRVCDKSRGHGSEKTIVGTVRRESGQLENACVKTLKLYGRCPIDATVGRFGKEKWIAVRAVRAWLPPDHTNFMTRCHRYYLLAHEVPKLSYDLPVVSIGGAGD